MKQKEVFIF